AWGKSIQTPLADGRVRSSAAKNQMLRVRDLVTDEELLTISLPDSSAGPIVFSQDGKLLAAATRGMQATLRVFDVETAAEQMLAEELPSDPRTLSFSPDGTRLACGFNDGTALIWELNK